MLPSRPSNLECAPTLETSTADSQKADPLRKHRIAPAFADRADRTSFSSTKESDTGVAQSFTHSKTSSYLRCEVEALGSEEAIDDTTPSPSSGNTPVEFLPEEIVMLNPQSTLHGLVCPCDSFKGWKNISLGGKVASKSFGDLRRMALRWEWETGEKQSDQAHPPHHAITNLRKIDGAFLPGQSPFEKLPMELLGAIIDQLAIDIPPNGFTSRNTDLMSLLLTSRSLHSATLCTLYAQITIPHSRIFRKFLSHISLHPALGTIVRRLDFSHYNPTGAGMSRRERMETKNLIPETLKQCLELTPNLREFLIQEHIDDEVDVNVLRHLLCELPKLKAVDFCACSSTKFKHAWNEVLDSLATTLPSALSIERLGFHECTTLPAEVFSTLLVRLPNLTHLDVAHTRITDEALHSIPSTARLTHLNLSKCSFLTDEGVISFLAKHPAAGTLVYLNLGMDSKSHELFDEDSLATLLPLLPNSLRSLNLKGSKMVSAHIPLLLPLTKHLEELSLGRNLDLVAVSQLFTPDEQKEGWTAPQLRYLDVSDLPLASLDLPYLFSTRCPLLKDASLPLEVLEVGAETNKRLEKSEVSLKRAGWCIKEAGRRWWLVRDFGNGLIKNGDIVIKWDNGRRGWKWGASYWGMRKIPVARADVGGMYGHYMFKR